MIIARFAGASQLTLYLHGGLAFGLWQALLSQISLRASGLPENVC